MIDTLIYLIEELIDRYLRAEPIRAADFGSIRDTITSLTECEAITHYLQEKKNFQGIDNSTRYCSPNDMLMEIRIRVTNADLGPPKGVMIQTVADAAKILRAVDAFVDRRLNRESIADEEVFEINTKMQEFRLKSSIVDQDLETVRYYITRSGHHVLLSPAMII